MGKDRISATVDPDVSEFLSRDMVNTSGLVNKLVKEYMDGGDESREMLQLRLEQLSSQIEQRKSQIESLESEKERVEERLNNLDTEQDEREELLQDAADHLSKKQLHTDAKPIHWWSDKIGMEPEELVDELWERIVDE